MELAMSCSSGMVGPQVFCATVKSAAEKKLLTPGAASAAVAEMEPMVPLATLLSTSAAYSVPGGEARSDAYFISPSNRDEAWKEGKKEESNECYPGADTDEIIKTKAKTKKQHTGGLLPSLELGQRFRGGELVGHRLEGLYAVRHGPDGRVDGSDQRRRETGLQAEEELVEERLHQRGAVRGLPRRGIDYGFVGQDLQRSLHGEKWM